MSGLSTPAPVFDILEESFQLVSLFFEEYIVVVVRKYGEELLRVTYIARDSRSLH